MSEIVVRSISFQCKDDARIRAYWDELTRSAYFNKKQAPSFSAFVSMALLNYIDSHEIERFENFYGIKKEET